MHSCGRDCIHSICHCLCVWRVGEPQAAAFAQTVALLRSIEASQLKICKLRAQEALGKKSLGFNGLCECLKNRLEICRRQAITGTLSML